MRTLRSFVRLPWRKQKALLTAGVMITTVRAGLTFLSFETLRRYLARLARGKANRGQPTRAELETIVWSVQTAGRTLPDAGRCLIEALAGHVLLGRKGYATDLRIGVTRDAAGAFKAHAWLENGDRVVLGELGPELQQYTPFPALRGLEPQ
jgi:hypothetical protein